ncbi:hypothetical protein D3C80_1919920 [compost metagenome]
MGTAMLQVMVVDELITHRFPALDLVYAAARILIKRNVEAFNKLRIAALDEVWMVFRIMLG